MSVHLPCPRCQPDGPAAVDSPVSGGMGLGAPSCGKDCEGEGAALRRPTPHRPWVGQALRSSVKEFEHFGIDFLDSLRGLFLADVRLQFADETGTIFVSLKFRRLEFDEKRR